MSKNISELSRRKGVQENLFMKLGQASQADGSPSEDELKSIAKEYLVGDATTYGTITAYDFMKPENQGKKIYLCNGSACLCAGTQKELHDKVAAVFDEGEIGHMTCLGRCHENSAFHYGGKNYSGNAIHQLPNIISSEDQSNNTDRYHIGGEPKVLTADYGGIAEFTSLLKSALNNEASAVLSEIKASSIRGRGGAGFPMGIKWESCAHEAADEKYIICNADEGDPGAYSDRYLLEERPYFVLFGMMMAGYCTGAQWGLLYIRAEYPESVDIVNKAIEELHKSGLLGEDILGSGFSFDFRVIEAKGAYICGEETALINSIEGNRPEVRTRPPYPTQQGLFNQPTIVNNVETLAAVYWIMQHGGEAYAQYGTERSKGTKLISLDSHFNQPGIYEVEMGLSLSTVIHQYGGGFKGEVKALHIGGPLGGIVPIHKVDDLTIDFESFGSAGFLLGHASVVSIPKDFPMINYIQHLFDFASFESCGKCFPCRIGTKRALEMTTRAIAGEQIDKALFDDLLDTLEQGSLCAHGGGIPLPVRNALMYFSDEFAGVFEPVTEVTDNPKSSH